MSNEAAAKQTSLFLAKIKARRFDEESLRILESVLVSKDVKSSIKVRSYLREFMRSESISIIREIAWIQSIYQKLSVLEFFLRAFALIADFESCLAIRYEALTLRELKSSSHHWLRVSHTEWTKFAEDCIENGFHAIARKACENALSCLKSNGVANPTSEKFSESSEVAEKIKRVRDCAVISSSLHSVQAQAAEYLRSKDIGKQKIQPPFIKRAGSTGSILFRDGIKKRNERMLQEFRSKQITKESDSTLL